MHSRLGSDSVATMPTVPSTCRSVSAFERAGIYLPGVADQIDVTDDTSGPTPDPDLDDVVLVPVVTGDGIGVITPVCNFTKR